MGVKQTLAEIKQVLGELAQLEAEVSLKKIHLQSLKRQLVREQAERAAERAGRGRKRGRSSSPDSSSSESETPPPASAPKEAGPSDPGRVLPLEDALPVPAAPAPTAGGGQAPGESAGAGLEHAPPVPANALPEAGGGQAPGEGAGAAGAGAAGAAAPAERGGGTVPGAMDEAPLNTYPSSPIRRERVTCRACKYRFIECRPGGPSHDGSQGCFKPAVGNIKKGYRPSFV